MLLLYFYFIPGSPMSLVYFAERNLNKTVSFLIKTFPHKYSGIDFSAGLQEIHSISLQNVGSHLDAYLNLLCSESKENLFKIVFCSCCISKKIFLRNSSLISTIEFRNSENSRKNIIKHPGFQPDPFLDFLEAKATSNLELLIQVIDQIPDFYEAYTLLNELSDTSVFLRYPISILYYLELKINKGIEIPNCIASVLNFILFNEISVENEFMEFLDDLKLILEKNLNLAASFYYCIGDMKKSRIIFERSIEMSSVSFNYGTDGTKYLYFYALLLYSQSASVLIDSNPFIGFSRCLEMNLCEGIKEAAKENYFLAKKIFLDCLSAENDSTYLIPDLHCLIAHVLNKLNEKDLAIQHLKDAILLVPKNFRVLYIAAQEFFEMQDLSYAFWYAKRALEANEDGGIWKLLGKIYLARNETELAKQCFEKSESMLEYDSLLYLADVYKKMDKTDKALEMYEKYVNTGTKNKEVVLKFLVSYYEDNGNLERCNYFKKMMT